MKTLKLILLFFPFMAMSQGKLDSLREKLVKDNTYEYVYYFENNYAVFRTFDEKMGLLDSVGNVIIKPIFSSISNRKKLVNLFEVGNKINNKYKRGFVDVKGNIIIPIIFDDVYYVGKELIRVTLNNKYGVLDTLNRVILPTIYDYVSFDNDIIIAGLNGAKSLYDYSGMQISNLQFTEISRFRNNRAIITFDDTSTAIIDHHGRIVLEPIDGFSFERVLNDSFVLIKNALNSKVGIVNAKGEFAISCNYDELKQANTFFIAESNNKKGILSLDESIVMPFVYDEIYMSYFYAVDGFDDYEIGEKYIVKKDNLFGVIDPNTENEIIPVRYKSISTLFDKYYLVQNTEERNGLFSENGETLLLEEYIFYNRFEEVIFATKNNKPLLIKLENKEYTETDVSVDEFIQFKDDYALFLNANQIFKLNDKYGVINYENSILIPGEYEFIENITYSDEFIVKKNNKYGIVNAENSTVVEFEYDEYKEFKEYMLLTKEKQTIKKYHPISFKY